MTTICEIQSDFKVYNGTDSVFGMFLLKNGVVIEDLSFITKVVIKVDTDNFDSDTAPAGTITWTDQGEYLGITANILKFKLGLLSITDGLKENCRITVYDGVNVNGIVFIDDFTINFISN